MVTLLRVTRGARVGSDRVTHLAAIIALVTLGCVEQGSGPQPKKIDPSYVQSHLLAAAPATIERFDVQVGEVAVYLGNTVDKSRVAPGQPVTITHYWKVLKAPEPSWQVFSLVRGPAGSADFMNLLATDMQIAHGPAIWEAGEIIEDVQTFTVRPDWRSKEATVLVGLIEHGKHGTLDRMATSGPRTQDNAIVARVLEIDLSRAPAPKGTAHVPRAQGAITIDGAGSDPGWVGAVQTELITAEGSGDPLGKAIAKMVWDDQFLYLHVNLTDSDIVSPFKQQDDPLWKGDCIEIFIDADGNKRGYVELQANPLGITFDSWFAETRARPGDEAWDSEMQAAAKLRGSVEAGDSGDTGWDVELAIPWAAVKGRDENMKIAIPPQVGDRWRLNVVRVDRKSGTKPTEAWASSWNRITMADFHALDRMLTVVFADASGSIVPQAKPVESGSGSAGAGSAAGSGSGVGSGSATMTGSGSAANPGSVAITLPGQTSAAPGPLTIAIPVTGDVVVNGRVVANAALDQLFRSAFARDKATQVVLQADKDVPHGRVVMFMERAKQAGLTRIAIGSIANAGSAASNTGSGSASPHVFSGTSPIDPKLASVVIEVLATGDLVVNNTSISDASLDQLLAAAFAKNKATQVVFKPGKGVDHGRVVKLMEKAKAIGLTRIAIGSTTR